VEPYTIYGDLGSREVVALATVCVAKGLEIARVEETASLSLALAARAGRESGPYLRTPEGFVFAELHAMLDWIERLHPEPSLLPTPPVRRTCARLLEDWIELWLPRWPRRSWSTLEALAVHLDRAGFLLGVTPTRPDYLLAAWLETEVLVHEHARRRLARTAPRLVSLGSDLLDTHRGASGVERGGAKSAAREDVVPISLLAVLEEVAGDYHAYLEGNQIALKDGRDCVMLDLGLGRRVLPLRPECEVRRIEIGRELVALAPDERRDVRRILEPVGAWHSLTWPAALAPSDPADPRNL
jgi:glutathione S-transferase